METADREPLRAALAGVDTVIHTARRCLSRCRRARFTRPTSAALERPHEALAAGVKRFVFYLQHGCVRRAEGPPDRRRLADDPLGHYGASKVEAEKICHQYQKRGLNVKSFVPRLPRTGRLGVFEILFEWIAEGRRIPLPAMARTTSVARSHRSGGGIVRRRRSKVWSTKR